MRGTTPFLTAHDPLALGLFFSSRGIVRVTQRRTSPRGKPSTPGGGAVPPNWSGSQGPPGRPRPSGAPFCADSWSCLSPAPRHSAFLNMLQERRACRIQKGLQGIQETLGAVAFPTEEVPAFPMLLFSIKRALTHLPTSERGVQAWT